MKESINAVTIELKGNLIMISNQGKLHRAWEVSNLTAVDEFRKVVNKVKAIELAKA